MIRPTRALREVTTAQKTQENPWCRLGQAAGRLGDSVPKPLAFVALGQWHGSAWGTKPKAAARTILHTRNIFGPGTVFFA